MILSSLLIDDTVGSNRVYLYDHFGSLATTASSVKSDTLRKAVALAGLSSIISALLFQVLMMVMSVNLSMYNDIAPFSC